MALDRAPRTLAGAMALAARSAAGAREILDPERVFEIVGSAGYQPDAVVLASTLAEARKREAFFDSAGARMLRDEIVAAFARARFSDPAITEVAAGAALDSVAALMAAGDQVAASQLARDAWRRFGVLPTEDVRYAPAVVALVAAQQEAAEDRVRLRVRSDEPGMIYAEGVRLGASDGELEAEVAKGTYRIWLATSAGWSLPHLVEVESAPVELRIDMALDRRLEPAVPLVLDCSDPCPTLMRVLGERLGVDRIVGVRSSPALPAGQLEAVSVAVADGEVETALLDSASGLLRPAERFRLTALLPFGVGQLAQRRYAFGGSYLAAEVALLGWHLYARHQFTVARRGADLAEEERRRRATNLSLALLLGAMGANVIEAIFVGYVKPTF